MQKIVGNALKKERELRGISLEEISREMNITLRYLIALENEDFSVIPGYFYVKYYIRCYLKALGADETYFFNKFNEYLDPLFSKKQMELQELRFEKLRYARFRKKRILIRAALVLVVLAVAGLIGRNLLPPSRGKPTGTVQPSLPPLPGLFYLPTDRFCYDYSPVTVSIDCLDRCWIRVLRGGEKIAERIFEKGDSARFHGYRLSLMLGNPAGVRVMVNGRGIPDLSGSEGPVSVDLTPDKLQSLLLP